jgi:hypothetical protein
MLGRKDALYTLYSEITKDLQLLYNHLVAAPKLPSGNLDTVKFQELYIEAY